MATSILHTPRATAAQARAWATAKGAPDWYAQLAATFWAQAIPRGVDPLVAFIQSCKETGFGHFGRATTPEHHNPAGLKVRRPVGPDTNPADHVTFRDWASGIGAQADHLAAYAGAQGYPRRWPEQTADQRNDLVAVGTAPTVELLGGRWAPDPHYGEDIVAMMRDLVAGAGHAETPSSEVPMTTSGDSPLVSSFLQAKRYHAGGNLPITRIVIHDEEYPERPDAAETIATYFHNMPDGRAASAHYVVDDNSIVQCVREADTAYHAPPNAGSIGIENSGYSRETRAEWLDAYSTANLKLTARLVADLCARHKVPIVRLSSADLVNGKHGICGHVDVSNAFHQSDHGDPGPSFPWDTFMSWVHAAAGTAEDGEELPVDQATFNKLMDGYFAAPKGDEKPSKGYQVWKAAISRMNVGPGGAPQDVEVDTIVKAVAEKQGIDVLQAVKDYIAGQAH